MRGRRALVTGAGGFVGGALASGFAELGWEVTGLDRAFDSDGPLRDPTTRNVRHITADLADAVPPEVPEVDLVIHAAWVTTPPEKLGVTAEEYRQLNLHPLRTLLDGAARLRPASFVFLSSSGVFAPDDADGGLTDADRPTGRSPYAVAKREAETLVSNAYDSDSAAHVVRLGHLYGPGETARPSRTGVSHVARWLEAAKEGRSLDVRADDPARDWTFATDLAGALARVVSGPSAGRPIHLGSSHVWRDGAVAELIASRFPGVELVSVPTVGAVKPPMVASDVPTLGDFEWTDPPAGLQAILSEEVAA